MGVEAAGRRASLSLAAAERHVTLSAISHQLRELETALGVALTRRQGRGRCVDLVAEGFDCAVRYGPGGWPGLDAYAGPAPEDWSVWMRAAG